MSKVLFRLDAGPDIGLGHFMRCRTLAMAMRQLGWQSVFVGHDFSGSQLVNLAQESQIELVSLPKFDDCGEDAHLFAHIAGKMAADILIVDNYSYKSEALRVLQQRRLKVVAFAFDGIANEIPEVQVLLNPNPSAVRQFYEGHGIDLVLCGSDYTLIRPEISELRSRNYCQDGPVLLLLGGGNVSHYLTGIAPAIMAKTSQKLIISISGNYESENLRAWARAQSDRCELNTDMNRFPQLLAEASLVITGAGGTLWEACCLGLPWLGVIWVDNQRHAAEVAKKFNTGLTVDCSKINDDTNRDRFNAAVITAFEKLLASRHKWPQMIDAQRALIDGNGAHRAAEQITRFFDN